MKWVMSQEDTIQQDMWKMETQGLFLFRISCQQLLIYNTKVKSKMTGVPDDDRKAFFYRVFCYPRGLVWQEGCRHMLKINHAYDIQQCISDNPLEQMFHLLNFRHR